MVDYLKAAGKVDEKIKILPENMPTLPFIHPNLFSNLSDASMAYKESNWSKVEFNKNIAELILVRSKVDTFIREVVAYIIFHYREETEVRIRQYVRTLTGISYVIGSGSSSSGNSSAGAVVLGDLPEPEGQVEDPPVDDGAVPDGSDPAADDGTAEPVTGSAINDTTTPVGGQVSDSEAEPTLNDGRKQAIG